MRFNGRRGVRAPGEVAAIILVSTLQLASAPHDARTKPSIAMSRTSRGCGVRARCPRPTCGRRRRPS